MNDRCLIPKLAALALVLLGLVGGAGGGHAHAQAQSPVGTPAPSQLQGGGIPVEATAPTRSLSGWLMRLQEASRRRAYIGTLVVSSGTVLSSSRIWHVCDGEQQIERVESLTGVPRSTFRRNEDVITFSPDTRVARMERRDALGSFPGMLRLADHTVEQFYSVKELPGQRVAGLDADVVQLLPRDGWRFGYRIWSEKQTGLVLKLQTLDSQGHVLEQQAFSELQLDAPVSRDKLTQMMRNTEGYKVERVQQHKTTATAEGWSFKPNVPGFKPVSCFRHGAAEGGAPVRLLQCVYSDGLASLSVFIAPHDASQQGLQEGVSALGATQALTRRVPGRASDSEGGWWLTLVGEVPASTLQAFAQGLERRK